MATADLTVIGLGRSEVGASRYIAEMQRRLAAQTSVRYRLHAMGTSLEGETAEILRVVGDCTPSPSTSACRASTPSSSSTSAATVPRRSTTRWPPWRPSSQKMFQARVSTL